MKSIIRLHQRTTLLLKLLILIISVTFILIVSIYTAQQVLNMKNSADLWTTLFENRVQQVETMVDSGRFEIAVANTLTINNSGTISNASLERLNGITLNKTGLFGKIVDLQPGTIEVFLYPDMVDGIQRVHFVKRYTDRYDVHTFNPVVFFPDFTVLDSTLNIAKGGVIWYSSDENQLGNIYHPERLRIVNRQLVLSFSTDVAQITETTLQVSRPITTDVLVLVGFVLFLGFALAFLRHRVTLLDNDYITLRAEQHELSQLIEGALFAMGEPEHQALETSIHQTKTQLETLQNHQFEENLVYERLIESFVERTLTLLNAINRSNLSLQERLNQSISTLSRVSEVRDRYTAGHQKRTQQLALALAHELNLTEEQISNIAIGAVIFDIGKISIPSDLLGKPDALTPIERRLVQTHVESSLTIIREINLPQAVYTMVEQHHERMDGSGYPQGLSGEAITLEARILGLADVVEAMLSHRPYRPAYSLADTLTEIRNHRQTRFDAQVVDACLRLFTEQGFTF